MGAMADLSEIFVNVEVVGTGCGERVWRRRRRTPVLYRRPAKARLPRRGLPAAAEAAPAGAGVSPTDGRRPTSSSVSAHASEPRAARRLSANGDTSLSSLPVSSRPADRPPVIPPPLPVAATVETAFTEGNRGNDG